MCPQDDTFLSASVDGTIRLWNLNQSREVGVIDLHPHIDPLIAYDQSGLIFAVGLDSNSIRLYDATSYEKVKILLFLLIFRDHLAHLPLPTFHRNSKHNGLIFQ